ncbi:hypothetical protein KJ877_06675 [bacterium]|nr:hypothetical protein [bacterium]MBU1991326.1 hypothetical protein [bacterium]
MKNLFLFFSILLLFNGPVNADDVRARVDTFPEKEMLSQNSEIVKLVVAEISKDLPLSIDNYTTFTHISADKLTLLYTFEINTGAKDDATVKKEDRTRMKKAVFAGVCQSSRKFLEAGINTSYIYINANTKAHLFEFNITQKDCAESVN